MTLPNVSVEIAHPGAPVSTDWTAERLLSRVHPDKRGRGLVRRVSLLPDVHGQLLFGDEPLAALWTDVLPAVVPLVGLLAEVQAAPENISSQTQHTEF